MSQEKAEFLKWLDRFARFPKHLRLTIERHAFTTDELASMRRQIESKWKIKKEYLERRGA